MRKNILSITILYMLCLGLAISSTPRAVFAESPSEDELDYNDEEFLPASARIAMQHSDLPTGDFVSMHPETELQVLNSSQTEAIFQAMETYEAPQTSLVYNRSDYYYYYNHLDPLSKQIYDVMLEITKDPEDPGNWGLLYTELNPESDEFFNAYGRAWIAMTYDHPELFWLYNFSEAEILFASDLEKYHERYTVFFGISESYDNYETEMRAFNSAVEEFLSDIDQSGSQYETVLQIHDKLIDLITYDDAVCDGGENEVQNLGHTAYGALVEDSWGNANYAVCDGYSLAFEYLLQQCGIPAIFMAGEGGMSYSEMGGHAWNMVNVDGVWYETDITWDDFGNTENSLVPGMAGYDMFLEALHNDSYRNKIDHFLFLTSTDTISHFVPKDNEWDYYASDGSRISLVGECMHVRLNELETIDKDHPESAVIKLAPFAEGIFKEGGQ